MRKYVFIGFVLTVVVQMTCAFGAITIESGSLEYVTPYMSYEEPLDDQPYSGSGDVGYVEWSGLASPIRYVAHVGSFYNYIDQADCEYGMGYCDMQQWDEFGEDYATALFKLSSTEVFKVTHALDGDLGLEIANGQTGDVFHSGKMATLPPVIYLAPGTWDFQVSDIGEGVVYSESEDWYDDETGSYDYSSYSGYDTSGWVEIINTVLTGSVVTIGDVDPGGTGVQSDPWQVRGSVTVGGTGAGTLNVTDGGVVSNSYGYIGRYAGSTGVAMITGTGSQWNNSENLYVGKEKGAGTLNVENAGVVSNTHGFIGEQIGSTGEATVTGASSRWNNSGMLFVGYIGTGTLNVTDGGVVSNTLGSIGYNAGSTGEATVTGAGSRWNNSGTLDVGYSGSGTLNVESGGVVANMVGYIGNRSGSTGEATVTGAGSQWNNSGHLFVGDSGSGTLNVEAGGVVSNTSGYIGYVTGSTGTATVTGASSRWNNSGNLFVGRYGTSTLNVESGGVVSNTVGYLGHFASSTGEATVTGANSQWNNSGDLVVGGEGNGTLNIENEGLVTVGGTTSIGAAGTVNLTGGRFEFGQTTLAEFSTINATGGAMAGNVHITGVNDVASLTALQNSLVDLNEVAAVNEGLLHGSAILKSSLKNRASGELRTTSSDWVRFEGDGNINSGEINNFDGQVDFAQDMTNEAGGFIGGRGQFVADGGWTNRGVMAFSGTADILGGVVNDTGGQIVTSGGATTTIFDDLEHNGAEIRTSEDGRTVIFGQASGAGDYTGAGTVYFEGDLRPGNSSSQVSFDGNVVLGPSSATEIELGGTVRGNEYDAMIVNGDFMLDGSLDVLAIGGYTPQVGDLFDIFDFEPANLSGLFDAVNLPALASDMEWDQTNLYTTGELLVSLSQIAGDFDSDGDVDGDDFLLWQRNFPVLDGTAGSSSGDANSDGNVDGDDFLLWQSNFPFPTSLSAVPEPHSLMLFTLGGLVVLRRRLIR